MLDGETLAQRDGGRLAAACAPVLEVATGAPGCRPWESSPRARARSLRSPLRVARPCGSGAAGRPALLVAVDLPAVGGALLAWLRDRPGAPTAVPRVEGRLAAGVRALRRRCAARRPQPRRSAAIRSLHELLDVVDHDVVPEAEWGAVAGPDAFLDIDTPADAERFGLDLPGLA